jgi:hypothetical protein
MRSVANGDGHAFCFDLQLPVDLEPILNNSLL